MRWFPDTFGCIVWLKDRIACDCRFKAPEEFLLGPYVSKLRASPSAAIYKELHSESLTLKELRR